MTTNSILKSAKYFGIAEIFVMVYGAVLSYLMLSLENQVVLKHLIEFVLNKPATNRVCEIDSLAFS